MYDAAQRWLAAADLVEDTAERVGIGDIPGIKPNLAPQRLELGHPLGRAGRVGAAPTQQRNHASAMLRKPTRRLETEAGNAAGDQIGAVPPQRHVGRLAEPDAAVAVRQQHQLADVTGGLH